MFREQARKRLTKKAKKGFRGFPVATVAFYGPDNRRASKLAVGIVLAENEEAVELKRWFAEPGDVRELPHVREHRLYLLARALAEPPSEREQPRVLQLLPSATALAGPGSS